MRLHTPRVPAAPISPIPATPAAGRPVTVYDSRGRAIDLRLSIRELRAAARAAGIPDGIGGDDPSDRDALERALIAHYRLEVPAPSCAAGTSHTAHASVAQGGCCRRPPLRARRSLASVISG